MKRQGSLIESIADIDNLRCAYFKARKSKEAGIEVKIFLEDFDANLLTLQSELLSGKVNIGNYHYFTIFDPKERTICAASFPERVLHHAIMNICHANFEQYQIYDSYASRKGKGTYKAVERAKTFQRKYRWFLKLDVRKYFYSINHDILKVLLNKRFKDTRLLEIMFKIIDSYHVNPNVGLPIGNLTSQYFANHYLAVADHYVKEELKIPAYVRYMDDMVLWCNNKEELLEIGAKFQYFLFAELGLEIKPFCLNRSEKGLPFLGYLIFSEKIRLAKRSRTRFITKLKLYDKKLALCHWDQAEYQNHILPLIAFTQHADCTNFRKKVMAYNPKALTA